ncbi:protein EXORDIUM-like 2 [Aristolochia californica]|uniref:protein EXORDIUM-like 2 n=1 Tax=Aristolochia californica TaxID=171875 RepID=UPI0035DBAE18
MKMVAKLLKTILSFPALVVIFVCLGTRGILCINGENPASLVPSTTKLEYHHGPLLTGPSSINVYLLWYGSFPLPNKLTISDFFASFQPSPLRGPTVSSWWRTAGAYKDARRTPVSSTVKLAGQISDARGMLGKNLKRADLTTLVKNAILNRVFPLDPNGVYLVLTASDVAVERFCMGSCGFHDTLAISATRRVVFAHVGDSAKQCPGLCAWPYAVPAYGPPGSPLVAPNGVGVDGMVINIATILAGSTTNPFKNGYFQGDELAPLEAVTACPGIFGADAYPGYPGKLMTEQGSRASFNAFGAHGRRFLLPAMWDPVSLTCKV